MVLAVCPHRAHFLSPAWVSYSQQSGQEHRWRPVKSVQPSLCALLKASQDRAANAPALLSSACSSASEPPALPGMFTTMVQHNLNVALLHNKQERRIQKQEAEERFSI